MAMRRPTMLELLVAVGIIALLISIVLPTLGRMRESSTRVRCGTHLRQIGQALLLYANEHGGLYPPSLETMVNPEQLTPKVLNCDISEKPFVFLAAGGPADSFGDEDVIVYDPSEHHDGEGSYLLYGSGRVNWESTAVVKQYLARAATRRATTAATRNP